MATARRTGCWVCCCENLIFLILLVIYSVIEREFRLSPSQAKAVAKYRGRLANKGMARFEVLGRKSDSALIRNFALVIAEDNEKAAAFRDFAEKIVGQEEPKRGSILAAFRRSPWVGAELDLTRSTDDFRTVEF